VEEHWIVVSREAAASEEVERIGVQTAELVGHVNGDQKINYVETMRRDMGLMRAVRLACTSPHSPLGSHYALQSSSSLRTGS
jgi:hypothetical protein